LAFDPVEALGLFCAVRADISRPAQLARTQNYFPHGTEEAVQGLGSDPDGRRGLVGLGSRELVFGVGWFFEREQGFIAIIARNNRR
jgi:hypothetical protein